jgi:hypothetical protein
MEFGIFGAGMRAADATAAVTVQTVNHEPESG